MLVSVYIRKADEDRWRKLPNKTEAISKLLRGQQLSAVAVEGTLPFIVNKKNIGTDRPSIRELNVKFCKIHGTPLDSRGKCLQKKCKYG